MPAMARLLRQPPAFSDANRKIATIASSAALIAMDRRRGRFNYFPFTTFPVAASTECTLNWPLGANTLN
jgi:hypothetical protein